MIDIGWLGDTHADPNHDNDLQRFTDCGKYFASLNLDVVVQIGDWFDMPSITDHRGKLEREGDRYRLDIECGNQAIAQFMKPFYRRKKKLPRFIFIEGNHEYRVQRYVQQNPQMSGFMGRQDFDFRKRGWEYIPYGRRINIHGFYTVHCIIGKNGRALTLGPTFTKRGVSMVVGHSHEMQHIILPREDRYTHGIDLGCLTKRGYGLAEDWSAPNDFGYWRGAHIMRGVRGGDYQEYHQVRAEVFTND